MLVSLRLNPRSLRQWSVKQRPAKHSRWIFRLASKLFTVGHVLAISLTARKQRAQKASRKNILGWGWRQPNRVSKGGIMKVAQNALAVMRGSIAALAFAAVAVPAAATVITFNGLTGAEGDVVNSYSESG